MYTHPAILLPAANFESYVQDICHLLDHLGIAKVISMGFSGGGPYALAFAHMAPERTLAVVTLAGATYTTGPDVDPIVAQMDWSTRTQEYMVCHTPRLLKLSLVATRPFMFTAPALAQAVRHLPPCVRKFFILHLISSGFSQPDKEALAAHPNFTLKLLPQILHDCTAQGIAGLYRDMRLTSLPWSFKPSEIPTPLILLFQGEEDSMVPKAMGEYLAKLLGPKCRATYLPGEGHLSLLLNRGQDVFDILIKALQEEEGAAAGAGSMSS